jgi:hypothetical protein
LRAFATTVHFSLRKLSPIDEALTSYLLESGNEVHEETMLGAICISAFDEDRQVEASSRSNLEFFKNHPTKLVMQSIEIFLERVIFEPEKLHLLIYGPLRSSNDTSGTSEQAGTEFEDITSRYARWRSGGIRALVWLLG